MQEADAIAAVVSKMRIPEWAKQKCRLRRSNAYESLPAIQDGEPDDDAVILDNFAAFKRLRIEFEAHIRGTRQVD